MKISFIGFGNLAKILAQSLATDDNYQIYASSPSLSVGKTREGIITHYDNLEIIADAEIIILAVKPVNMSAVLTQINTKLPENCLIISVAAGLTLAWLAQHCPKEQAIIRSMPNIAIAIGKGATPLFANSSVTPPQKRCAEQIFKRCGIITWATQETEMDVFTALSGSGPAYIFLFLEAMIDAAKHLGLNEEIAKIFALQTMDGALNLAMNSSLELSTLRKKVTSPAGTTAAAIDILQQQGFAQLIFKAMNAATERANQLGLSM
ncbi:pyrroline-5-carboxylate reductase [Legionella fairfieldensis]|uniref:pyrroline-5-carboxylate reductase n=1 Tax=Legionella fairfieldensis TaxID=45064 RepID=UPI00048C8CF2|nr:pyrroline-5-carboxylate reductase [Legionella fairfieldensis]